MAAVPNKPKPRELCPNCYELGVENDLQYKPGARFDHFCSNGHQWDDRELLSQALLIMNQKLRLKKAQEAPAVPDPVPDSAPTDNRIKIDPIDYERIRSFLGDFGDSSTLFGLIFAQNESIKDLREKLERAEARVVVGQIRKLGGDHVISVNIPERHVQSIKDIAEAGGMSIERFMQARIEDGLDNQWYC